MGGKPGQWLHIPYAPGVYCITNKINGREYVGSSTDMNQRCRKHKSNLHHRVPGEVRRLQADFDRYGWSDFKFSVLELVPLKELREAEREWIASIKPYYNVSEFDTTKGTRRSEVQLERMRIAQQIVAKDPERRRRMSETQRARMADPIIRAEMKIRQKKVLSDPKVRAKMSESGRKRWGTKPFKVWKGRVLIGTFEHKGECAKQLGMSMTTVYDALNQNGKSKGNGYTFQYLTESKK